jgi:ketosteroid isomerase-like protein
MRYLLALCFAFCLIFSNGCINKKDSSSEIAELVKSEYAFAELSVRKGIKEAFVTYLSDEAIVFRPRPVKGKPIYQERPATPAQLNWWPTFADIASTGDMGYTTGPWEIKRDSSDAEPVAFGHFVSVWKKQTDGSWRVAIDAGTSHQPPPVKAAGLDVTKLSAKKGKSATPSNVSAATSELLETDRAFAAASSADGFRQAFEQIAGDSVRYYREGAFPLVGKAAAQSALTDLNSAVVWQPMAGDVSQSGDLGYTYGIAQQQASDTNGKISELSYMHIWKKSGDGQWQLLLQIMTPVPPENSN